MKIKGGAWRGFVSGAGVAEGGQVDVFKEFFACSKEDWRYGKVHCVNQPLPEELLDPIDSAPDPYVPAASGFACLGERVGDAVQSSRAGASIEKVFF